MHNDDDNYWNERDHRPHNNFHDDDYHDNYSVDHNVNVGHLAIHHRFVLNEWRLHHDDMSERLHENRHRS